MLNFHSLAMFLALIFATGGTLNVLESASLAADRSDSIREFTGQWDLPGTLTSIEIRDDHSVLHSMLGAGDIKLENADYFEITYRSNFLACRYQIKRYSENELSMVLYLKTDPAECELGLLRRAPKNSGETQKEHVSTISPGDGQLGLPEPGSSKTFHDCSYCPELVIVPAGSFVMGSPEYEVGRDPDEGPQRRVIFREPFAVGRFAVTVDEYSAFVKETAYRVGELCGADTDWQSPKAGSYEAPPGFDLGFTQTGRNPAVCVSWYDAKAYVEWLSKKTNQRYRLLSEAEREYVTRAGTSTPYWWGTGITPAQALYDTRPLTVTRVAAENRSASQSNRAKLKPQIPTSENSAAPPGHTALVDAYKPNDWGLYQVHGNVAEWTEDCWSTSILSSSDSGAPVAVPNCSDHVLRGGAWSYWPAALRAAHREPAPAEGRYNHVGFRVARDVVVAR
jgi:formylglycine-generating enzyme required for sulfatase activity